MVDKYYTPLPKEFYIGFEYETNYLQDYDNWVKETLSQEDASYFFDSYITDASPLEFRVKYLDKEDIESLGWRRDKLRAFQLNKQFYYKNNLVLFYNADKNELSIITRDPSLSEEFSRTNIDPDYVHKIIIKNKSELKVLLKQLNII